MKSVSHVHCKTLIIKLSKLYNINIIVMNCSFFNILLILLISIVYTKCMPTFLTGKIYIPISFGVYTTVDYPFIRFWTGDIYRLCGESYYCDDYNNDEYDDNDYSYSDYNSKLITSDQYTSLPPSSSSSSSSLYNKYENNYNYETLESGKPEENSYSYYENVKTDKTPTIYQKYDEIYETDDYQTPIYADTKYTKPTYNRIMKTTSNDVYSNKYNDKTFDSTSQYYKNYLAKEPTYKYNKPNVHESKKSEYDTQQYKVMKSANTNDKTKKYHNKQESYQTSVHNNRPVTEHHSGFSSHDYIHGDEIMQTKYYFDQFADDIIKQAHTYKDNNKLNNQRYQQPKHIQKKSHDNYETRYMEKTNKGSKKTKGNEYKKTKYNNYVNKVSNYNNKLTGKKFSNNKKNELKYRKTVY
ncbi:hypothetical protein MN116_007215 [Schistosoma mekongi]|uniref:Uncharacterized protein n=1 Tax=Schistosoma mekongi TaxID=38744 RepID=A0AAE2D3E1_SCHME|nr:hypothetical protein MN116_007215 [Schistosoma mekongi]